MDQAATTVCVLASPSTQGMVVVSQGCSFVTLDIQKEISPSSASDSVASEALPPPPGPLHFPLPSVASPASDEVLVERSFAGEGSSLETSTTSTLPELVNEIKKTMGYSDGTDVHTILDYAASDLEIVVDGTAKSKANRIAEKLGLRSRCRR